MLKICCKCKIEKPIQSFSLDKRKKDGHRYNCKECDKERMRIYDASEKGKQRSRKGMWNKQNINITNDGYLVKYKNQNGECCICNKKFNVLCVDHNHTTGNVRGLLCKQCNLGIGNLQDNIDLLHKAIKYLKEYENDTENHI